MYNFLNKKWFFDKIYNEIIGQFFFKFGYTISYKLIDRAPFEILGPTGLSKAFSNASYSINKLQTGSLYHYTFIILGAFVSFLFTRQLFVLFSYDLDLRVFVILAVALFFCC